MTRQIRALRSALVFLVVGFGMLAQAQDGEDLLLLTSQFGELCTTCEVYLKCEADTPPGSETIRLRFGINAARIPHEEIDEL